jgi:two-component system cell cycle sensor histidine kinase/response regulator CckA
MRYPATILLVENGEMLRPLLCAILKREGYKVVEAKDGDEALAAWEHYQGQIDVVITDMVMPNMSGKKLVERLRLLKPKVKIIYISGYESSLIFANNQFGPDVAFLQKPFRPVELSKVVREMLKSQG